VNSLPKTVYLTASRLGFEPRPFCVCIEHANHSATEPPSVIINKRKLVSLSVCAEKSAQSYHSIAMGKLRLTYFRRPIYLLIRIITVNNIVLYVTMFAVRNKPTLLSYSWWRGTVVERRSLAGELSLSCARPAADG